MKLAEFGYVLNAQFRLRRRSPLPLSVRLRGRAYVGGTGNVVLGEGVSLVGSIVPVELETYTSGRIEIGDRTFINYGCSIAARQSVRVGADCFIGHYTFVMDNDQHDVVAHTTLPMSHPVVIEDHVWIGTRVIILPGVRIGTRAVIGAGSVVTKDVPPRCVVAGNPARIIRYLPDQQ